MNTVYPKTDRLRSGRTWAVAGSMAVLILALIGLMSVDAKAAQVAGGTTSLKLDKGVAKVLKRAAVVRWLDRATGGVFVAFGLRLALDRR